MTSPSARALLSLQGIHKSFPSVHALDGVSLEIEAGEVHALIGENGAGKSTLINILAGELQQDDGTIIVDGTETRFTSPNASQRLGISIVHQELALCPNLTVTENISMQEIAGRPALQLRDRRAAAATASAALEQLGAGHIPLNTPVQRLRLAEQQLVEIAKAITQDVRLLVLDEPNSALTVEESEHLFKVVRDLRDRGVSVLYVSHRLEEVLALADRITVMRDGRVIKTLQASDATIDALIALMVGREIDSLLGRSETGGVRSTLALEVRHLSDARTLRDVSFTVHDGEVLGVAGLPGSGKDELVDCLFGLRPHTGELRKRGKPVRIASPNEAIKNGLALIPADRRGAGAFLVMNIRQNVIAASLDRVASAGFLRRRASAAVAERYFRELDMRASGLGQKVGTLSGGNQQKVVLAKGLATGPDVLLLHEPTRGIDVGAKAEIYGILQGLAQEGRAVIIVSSEMSELIGQCDRLLVMFEGSITGDFDRTEFAEESILACAMGQAVHLPKTGAAA